MGLTQETHDLGNLFWSTIRIRKGSEIYHASDTHEIDPPYRTATAHIFRLPFTTFALSVGRWKSAGPRTEEEAILAGLSGRNLGDDRSFWGK